MPCCTTQNIRMAKHLVQSDSKYELTKHSLPEEHTNESNSQDHSPPPLEIREPSIFVL